VSNDVSASTFALRNHSHGRVDGASTDERPERWRQVDALERLRRGSPGLARARLHVVEDRKSRSSAFPVRESQGRGWGAYLSSAAPARRPASRAGQPQAVYGAMGGVNWRRGRAVGCRRLCWRGGSANAFSRPQKACRHGYGY
jgi:hypothetical protein